MVIVPPQKNKEEDTIIPQINKDAIYLYEYKNILHISNN
jgi:hypothetical protein